MTDVKKTRRRLWLRLAYVAVAVVHLVGFRVSVALAEDDWGGTFPFPPNSIVSKTDFSKLSDPDYGLPDALKKIWRERTRRDEKPWVMASVGKIEESYLSHFFPGEKGWYIFTIGKVGPSQDGGQYRGDCRVFYQLEGEAYKGNMPMSCDEHGRLVQTRLGKGENDAIHIYLAGLPKMGLCERTTVKSECGHTHTTDMYVPGAYLSQGGLGSELESYRQNVLRKLGLGEPVPGRWPLPLLTGCPLVPNPAPSRLPLTVVPAPKTYPLTIVPQRQPTVVPRPQPTFGKELSRNAAYSAGAGLIGYALDSLVLKLLQSQAESGHVGAQQILESMAMQQKIISNAKLGLMPDGARPKSWSDNILLMGVTGYSFLP